MFDLNSVIVADATKYGVNYDHLYKTLYCESGLNPNALGDHGTSFGVAQFHLPTDLKTAQGTIITKDIALDPIQAIDAASYQFSIGNASRWTCWRNLYRL